MNVKTSLLPFYNENDKHQFKNRIKWINQRIKNQAYDRCRRYKGDHDQWAYPKVSSGVKTNWRMLTQEGEKWIRYNTREAQKKYSDPNKRQKTNATQQSDPLKLKKPLNSEHSRKKPNGGSIGS